jgi:hypothetical protein
VGEFCKKGAAGGALAKHAVWQSTVALKRDLISSEDLKEENPDEEIPHCVEIAWPLCSNAVPVKSLIEAHDCVRPS